MVRIWNLFQLTSVEDLHRTGSPHSIGAQDDRYLGLLSRRSRELSAPDLNSAFEQAKGRHELHQAIRRRICIPDDYVEHHIVHHNAMDSVIDGQGIMQNGRLRIGVGCCLRAKFGSVYIL